MTAGTADHDQDRMEIVTPRWRSSSKADATLTPVYAADGVALALHAWAAAKPRGAIFYIHGIQSHAGWLSETGRWLCSRGVSLYALDRRGSGRSGGPRGHLPSLELLLDDYRRGLGAVRRALDECAIVALGQSLGGSVLAGMWIRGLLSDETLVFAAPALAQQRSRHDADALARLRELSGLTRSPIGLRDEDYTRKREYLDLLAGDVLMLSEVTDQTRATLVHLEDAYMAYSHPAGGHERVFLGVPESDPIIDLAAARSALDVLAPGYRQRTFRTDRHYLEFTDVRSEYRSWLAEIATATSRS